MVWSSFGTSCKYSSLSVTDIADMATQYTLWICGGEGESCEVTELDVLDEHEWPV